MICPMVPFPVTLSDPLPRIQGHGVAFRPMNDLDVLCAQLTRDLFAIAKFLSNKFSSVLLHDAMQARPMPSCGVCLA